LISIWLCPDNDDELYIQNIINDLSDTHNCVRFYPHCTLLSGVKENNNDLENIIDKSIKNIGPIMVKSKRISFTDIFWKTVFIELIVANDLLSLQQNILKQVKSDIEYKFDPHISLIYNKMPKESKKKIINSLKIKSSFMMNKIVAVKTGQNISNWKKIVERKLYD
jgi:2'-5' RNA ligase